MVKNLLFQKSSLVGSRVNLSAEIEFRSHFWPRKVVLWPFLKNKFFDPREPRVEHLSSGPQK